MQNSRTSHILTSLATISCLALLLADSAEDYCGPSKSSFSQTFDYTTTCNGNHSGRIRISTGGPIQTPVAGGRTEASEVSMSLVSGELPNANAFLTGACNDEDDPTLFTGVQLNFSESSGTSSSSTSSSTSSTGGELGVVANCTVNLPSDLGKNVDCKDATGTTSAGCTLQLTALP